MAAFTSTEIADQLTLWKAALSAVSRNQSYSIQGRSLTRADIGHIRETIDWLEKKQTRLSQGGARVRYGVTEG